MVYSCQEVRSINRLRELREQRGYTQLKVALDLNLNQNSISRYESGSREAGYDMLIRFADYYGVSIDYILCRTDKPETSRSIKTPDFLKRRVFCFIMPWALRRRLL